MPSSTPETAATGSTEQMPTLRTIRPTIAPMPPKVARAINEVQKHVRKLGRDGNNTDGGNYKFTSVDAFLAFIGPLMAEAGLIIDVDEAQDGFEYYEVTKTYRNGGESRQHWMRARFVFTVAAIDADGVETWAHNPIRTIDVLMTGPQAYGSAQSYCLKGYLRALFKIPTGDMEDADQHYTDEGDGFGPGGRDGYRQGPQRQQAHRPQQRPAATQQQAQTPFDDEPPLDKITDTRELWKRLAALIDDAPTLDELNARMRMWGDDPDSADPASGSLLAKLPAEGMQALRDRANKRRGVLAQAPGKKAA